MTTGLLLLFLSMIFFTLVSSSLLAPRSGLVFSEASLVSPLILTSPLTLSFFFFFLLSAIYNTLLRPPRPGLGVRRSFRNSIRGVIWTSGTRSNVSR